MVRSYHRVLVGLVLLSIWTAGSATAAAPPLSTRQDVTFAGGSGVTLAGTLSLPAGRAAHPAVILITGSGPQDRDETIEGIPGYAPFRWIADDLTRQGFAVLRYDDRGVGRSTGNFDQASTREFADDAEGALRYLLGRREIDPNRIGFIGHSEGGIIAPMVAARNPRVAFIIGMAPPAVRGYDLLRVQGERVFRSLGADDAQVATALREQRIDLDLIVEGNWLLLERRVLERTTAALRALPADQRQRIGDLDAFARRQTERIMTLNKVWGRFFLTHDPAVDWARVRVPVLALFGVLDVQVDRKQNAPALDAVLTRAHNFDVTIISFSRANHLFQEAVTGSPLEYASRPMALIPGFLPAVGGWLRERFGSGCSGVCP